MDINQSNEYNIASTAWRDFDQRYPMFESNGLFGSGAKREFTFVNNKGENVKLEIETLDISWENENTLGLRFSVRAIKDRKTLRYLKYKKEVYKLLDSKAFFGGISMDIKDPGIQ